MQFQISPNKFLGQNIRLLIIHLTSPSFSRSVDKVKRNLKLIEYLPIVKLD